MATRVELRAACRLRLGDDTEPYHWSDDQIDQWINDAIGDYSHYFPMHSTELIDVVAQLQMYNLSTSFQGVDSVAYPSTDNPPRYLQRKTHTEPDFWTTPGLYDIVPVNSPSGNQVLYLSDKVTAGKKIRIYYTAAHSLFEDDAGATTVPDTDFELLIMFVRWVSYQELAMTESRNPDPTSLAMSTLELNAYRAERTYRKQIDVTLAARSQSALLKWKMDHHDRIY